MTQGRHGLFLYSSGAPIGTSSATFPDPAITLRHHERPASDHGSMRGWFADTWIVARFGALAIAWDGREFRVACVANLDL